MYLRTRNYSFAILFGGNRGCTYMEQNFIHFDLHKKTVTIPFQTVG